MSVLISAGETLIAPSQKDDFFKPIDLHWGRYELRKKYKDKIPGEFFRISNSNLTKQFKKVIKDRNSIGLGINLSEISVGKTENVFFNVNNGSLKNKLAEDIYILKRETCLLLVDMGVVELTDFQYAFYPNGRMVVYLFAEGETHFPTRIPASYEAE